MIEIVLTYPTDYGTGEIFLDDDKVSFGRGSEAEYRFEDDGLSRLHATVYREDDYIWIVDENSSNGTFVNGKKVGSSGTPLEDGDTIKIGHYTNIRVKIREKSATQSSAKQSSSKTKTVASASGADEKASVLLPLAITAFAFLIVASSVAFIGYIVLGSNGNEIAENPVITNEEFDIPTDKPTSKSDDNENSTETKNPNVDNNPSSNPMGNNQTTTPDGNTEITDSPTATRTGKTENLPTGKIYQKMSEAEKNQYVRVKAEKVARIIGNSSSKSIPPEAIAQIRKWLDGYVRRINNPRKNDCSTGGWLSSDTVSIMERAKQNAPFIVREFNSQEVSPYVGIYLAFIESEHCPCLQSPTGPLGLFQFTRATGKAHGLDTRRGASPTNPDQRCDKTAAAKAAASYMNSLNARIGTGPLSIPLAIASYNSGEGGLGKNLKTALTKNESQERSFWTLVANKQFLVEQFKKENIKYVPKFFGVAILGENPKDFGINMLPLSSYTK